MRDQLGEAGLPYLPELPTRGPGADIVGRGAALLVELPVDLQPSGWRMVDRPGRDLGRAQSYLRQDLDELAEAYDGWSGRLKVQATGPWTLASSVWLQRGERVVADAGAADDLVQSLAEGVTTLLGRVRGLVPGATLVLQLDEPSLPAALAGRLPTASGYGLVRTVDPQVAVAGLGTVLDAASAVGAETVVHCCGSTPPVALLRQTGAGLSLDVTELDSRGWEGLAVAIEDGTAVYLGCLPTDGTVPRAQQVADTLQRRIDELGMPRSMLGDLYLTPTCGLAGLTPQAARSVQQACIDSSSELSERALE